MVSLLADTGLRLSDLASLRVGDIKLEESCIAVCGEGVKQRNVCFGPFTQVLLEKYLDAYRPIDGLLGLKPGDVAKVLAGIESLTGIKCNAHSFRRTFATELVRNGMNLVHVQSLPEA